MYPSQKKVTFEEFLQRVLKETNAMKSKPEPATLEYWMRWLSYRVTGE